MSAVTKNIVSTFIHQCDRHYNNYDVDTMTCSVFM